MFQSTFGRKSFWSPRRGTWPEMLLRKLRAFVTCVVVSPLPVPRVGPFVVPERLGLLVPVKAGHVASETDEARAAVSRHVSARFRKSRAVKVETPGKLRFCWS